MFSQNRHPDGLVARIERDLGNRKNGLGLLGIKPCCCCGRFFRLSERSQLFDCGELVCLNCIHEWWTSRAPELTVEERDITELKRVHWLVNHHRAKVIRKTEEFLNPQRRGLHLVVSCARCDGTGISLRRRCQACDGQGTVCLAISG